MRNLFKPIIKLVAIAFVLVSFIYVGEAKPADAWVPSGLAGRVFTTLPNGERVYLTYSKIYREDWFTWPYCTGSTSCYGTNDGVQTGMGHTEFAMTNFTGDYMCGAEGGANVCAAGPRGGIPVNPTNACAAQKNWCGFNCNSNPHRVKAFFPQQALPGLSYKDYMRSLGIQNFNENDLTGKGGGTFIARCPQIPQDDPTGRCTYPTANWDGYGQNEYFELKVSNDHSYYNAEFEWIPPNPGQAPSCSISVNPSTVWGAGQSTITANISDPDSTQVSVLWSKVSTPNGTTCGTLDTTPDTINGTAPLNGTASTTLAFNGSEGCTSATVQATITDNFGNTATCTGTVSPKAAPMCQSFNIHEGTNPAGNEPNRGKNYVVPNANSTKFYGKLVGYDADVLKNNVSIPRQLQVCYAVANQSEAYYRRGSQVINCEVSPTPPARSGNNVVFNSGPKTFNEHVAQLPGTYTQGLNGTAASNGLVFFMKAYDSFEQNLYCSTDPGYNQGQGTLFPDQTYSPFCGNNCLARVSLTPPATNPPVITTVTPSGDSEWIGPVACSPYNAEGYSFKMEGRDEDGANTITRAVFEMNRNATGSPQVRGEYDKVNDNLVQINIGGNTVNLSTPIVASLNNRTVKAYILPNDRSFTLSGGYPIIIRGKGNNTQGLSAGAYTYIAYEFNNADGQNKRIWTNLKLSFNEGSGNVWNNGGIYAYNNKWSIFDSNNQSDTRAQGRTRIDMVKPDGSFTTANQNGNQISWTLNYNDGAGGSGLSGSAGEVTHLGLEGSPYTLTTNQGITYTLNTDSVFGAPHLFEHFPASGAQTASMPLTMTLNELRPGSLQFQARVSDLACNTRDINSTALPLAAGWLVTRAGLVYSGTGIDSSIPSFTSLDQQLLPASFSTYPYNFTRREANLGTELLGIGASAPLATIRDNISGGNGYFAVKTYGDNNNKAWYQELKTHADRNASLKPDRFEKVVGPQLLSGNISTVCTAADKTCIVNIGMSASVNQLICDRKAIVFVAGSLSVTNSQANAAHIANSGDINGCIFVVRGDVLVEGGASTSNGFNLGTGGTGLGTSAPNVYYDTIEAFMIADGRINIPIDSAPDGIKVWGGLLSFSNDDPSINIQRVIHSQNATNYPTAIFHHDPRYFEIASGIFESVSVYKRETGFKF